MPSGTQQNLNQQQEEEKEYHEVSITEPLLLRD